MASLGAGAADLNPATVCPGLLSETAQEATMSKKNVTTTTKVANKPVFISPAADASDAIEFAHADHNYADKPRRTDVKPRKRFGIQGGEAP